MTLGEQLLVACLKTSNDKVLSQVQRHWLEGEEIKQHKIVMDYYRSECSLMGVKAFCDRFKLDEASVDSSPEYYLRQLKERYIYAKVADKVPSMLRGFKDSPRDKLEELQKLVSELSTESMESKDSLYTDNVDERLEAYEKRKTCLGVTYLSMGADDMDATFYGYRETDLITIGGKAGQGKTWLMVYLAYLLELTILDKEEKEGTTWGDILFITNEMAEDEIKERLDCIRFKLPYGKFLQGTLNSREEGRYKKGLDGLKTKKGKLRIVGGCQTIDELTTAIGIYRPSAVFIDGSYLMESRMQEGWEKIVYITRNLKLLAKEFKTPIINTTQLKRGSAKSSSKFSTDGQDDFAYSNSYSQDSDIALRMFQDADMKYHDTVGMEVVKGRRVRGGTKVMFENNLDKMQLSLSVPLEEEEEPEEAYVIEKKSDF